MKKVYNSNGNYYKIYNKDCLIQMKKIKDKSIDLILCDLPYGTSACAWDTVIPFKKLWKQYKRIIKDTGVIALFGVEPFSSYLRMSNMEMYKYDWIWEKSKGANFLNLKYQPNKIHELISVFSKSASSFSTKGNMNYYPQMEKGKPYVSKCGQGTGKERDVSETANIRSKLVKTENINFGTRYPKSIIKFDSDIDKYHPTQKPVKLLEYLIKTYSNENDLVLDNTMGSGSTGVACINLKRNFIGMELEKKYYKIAKKRLEENIISLF